MKGTEKLVNSFFVCGVCFMNEKLRKLGFIFLLISILLLPGMQVLFVIGCNSKYLLRMPFFIGICILNVLLIVLLILGLIFFIKNKDAAKRKLRKWLKIFMSICISLYIIGCIAFVSILYGPYDKFRAWLITTAMATMDHQYLCKWFYNGEQIKEILSQNYIVESEEDTDPELIKQQMEAEKIANYNEYEKELLIHEEGQLYKIVKFEVNGADAYMAAIFDPSKVKLEVTQQIGVLGDYVTNMAARNNAVMAINAGGFIDGPNSKGEFPSGITIKGGQIITNNEYGYATPSGGIVGLTNDNILVLLKNKTAQEAVEMGVRDAISWGPFLVVNGEPSVVSGNGGWGGGARSAIGQRQDGTILFLQVGSNAYRTNGAGMEDLVEIMVRYGAYNASNLDGGTSSVLALRREEAIRDWGATCHDYFSGYACAINDPINAVGSHMTRYIADAWVVVE